VADGRKTEESKDTQYEADDPEELWGLPKRQHPFAIKGRTGRRNIGESTGKTFPLCCP